MFYGLRNPEDVRTLGDCLDGLGNIFGSIYAADDLIAVGRNTGFLHDARLQSAIERSAAAIQAPELRIQAKSKAWRLHTLTWAASTALGLPGDFVECGVFDGFTAAVVVDYVEFEGVDKSFYLYDTFSGLSPDYASEEELAKNAFFERHPEVNDICTARFESFGNVHIERGVVPDVLDRASPQTVSFLHLDMNCAQAEVGALEFFFDRMSPGGMIVLDDYGKNAFQASKHAADAFMLDRGHAILELPTGQGLTVRQPS